MGERGLVSSLGRAATAAITLGFAVAAAATIAPPTAGASTAQDEIGVRSLVASARSQAHLPALQADARLDSIARAQSERMADQQRIFHNTHIGSDADASEVHWTILGENVGVGQDIVQIERAFMASAHHRANILDSRFNGLGVGIATDRNGLVYVTQVFAQFGFPPAPSRANRPAPTVAQRPAGALAGSDLTRSSAACIPSGFRIARDYTLVANPISCQIPVES